MKFKNLEDGSIVTFSDGLLWIDEHQWTAAVAAVSYSLTGALIVETANRQAGRPITLAGSTDMGWITRATLNTLHDWASVSGRHFELTLADGRLFTVAFRHHEPPIIDAEPVTGFAARNDGDFYRATLRFMQV